MRKVLSRFKRKKDETSPDTASSTPIKTTSSAGTQTLALRSLPPPLPINTDIKSIMKGNSTPEITELLNAAESRPLTTIKPGERAPPPSTAIEDPLQQPTNKDLLSGEGRPSEAPFKETSDRAGTRNEAGRPQFNNKVIASGNHISLAPSGEHTPSTGSQEPSPPPTAAPHAVLSISESRITGRDIYNVIGNLEVHKDTTTRLQKLKSILNPVNAAWDSYEADQRSKCFENTRQQLLNDIEAWVRGDKGQAPIFVLDGVAGIGKSTIAQTVAERAAVAGILGASFYFTRNEAERMVAKHFFPTIAFQLACYSEAFARKIADALEANPDAPQKTIQQQLSLLILAPLQNLLAESGSQILIVIDALDECKEDEAETLLTLLAHHIPHLPRIKIFLTTRPEWRIRNVLSQDNNHALFHLHEIDDSIVQSDIQLYLSYSLSAQQVQRLFPHRQPPWQPAPKDMKMLCGICGTLFIIASTATKFILDTKAASPEKRLARLLDGVSSTDFSGSKRTDVMDRFYIQIIHQAAPTDADLEEIDEWFDRYRTVIGAIIILQNPLPCQALAQLLGMDSADIMESLLHLHSLVAPSGPSMIFRVHHKSFPDFITNANRIERTMKELPKIPPNTGQKLQIDTRTHHQQLAAACFRVMDEELKFNIGNIPPEAWFLDKADIVSLQDRSFKEELAYAASHWASHLHATGELDNELQGLFEEWAFTHIMAWLEVMNILGQIRRAHDMLDLALDAINAHPHSWTERNRVHALVSDTRRFLLQSGEVVALTPMHIYWSALPFIPRNTLLYRTYGEATSLSVISGIEGEWDPAALVTMTGHSDDVRAVAFSPNGKTLASASDDRTIRLWDGNTGAHLSTIEGHSNWVMSVVFSPDGARLASASNDRTICLWDVTTGARLIALQGHSNWVTSVAFSPDGARLASGSIDASICLWDGETGAHLITIKGHSGSVYSVTFSPDGLRLASASKDHTVDLWDGQTNAHITTFEGHSDEINSVAFSPNGLRLASASDDDTIRLWEATTGAHIRSLEGHSNAVYSVVFSPDGLRLASGSGDGTVRLWDATTGSPIITFNGHSGSFLGVAFSPDGSRLASASGDCTVRLWDIKAGSLKGHSVDDGLSSDPVSIRYSPLNHPIYLQNGKPDTPKLSAIHTHSGEVTAMAHSPSGSRFVSGQDSTLQLWDGKTGAHISTLNGHSSRVTAVAFSPDGSRLASGSYDNTIRLWDEKTGVHICTLDGHLDWIISIAFSPDGSKLASGSDDKTIWLWDGKTGTHITTLHGHSHDIRAIAFSPDGLRLLSASEDHTFQVWDGRSGCHLSTINPNSEMGAIAFSPSGSTFASMARDYNYYGDVINNNATLYLRTIDNIRPISLGKHFEYMASFTFLPSALHSTFSPPIPTTNDVTDPLFTHPAMSDYPLRIIALGGRQNPPLSGLVYLNVPVEGEPVMVPFCWFPPHIHVKKFSVDPTGSSIAVGCKDGRVLLLDISRIVLP